MLLGGSRRRLARTPPSPDDRLRAARNSPARRRARRSAPPACGEDPTTPCDQTSRGFQRPLCWTRAMPIARWRSFAGGRLAGCKTARGLFVQAMNRSNNSSAGTSRFSAAARVSSVAMWLVNIAASIVATSCSRAGSHGQSRPQARQAQDGRSGVCTSPVMPRAPGRPASRPPDRRGCRGRPCTAVAPRRLGGSSTARRHAARSR